MIQLKNISKYYYSKGMISSGISKVNLELNIGEFVVITGESGSGKTTLLNVISGLDSYEEGEMYIDGKETSHYLASDFEEYRKKYIGNIFQNFNLINSYTVYQNVELILLINGYEKDEIRSRVPEIIKRVGLEAYAKTKVSKLSGGQKQRVAIARALAKDTDIIVADEPTGNLDSVSAAGIVDLLSEISHDKLVIVVTHNYDQFAMHATRKIKMHDGSVVEDTHVKKDHQGIHEGIKVWESVNSHHGDRDITAGSKLRLGVRNTFNILPKFMLMLVVFLFIVFSVTSQYTTLRHQETEEEKLGFNDYFYNYSEDRVVLKKNDGSSFTEDDFNAIKNVTNIKGISPNDILLDIPLYIEDDQLFYEVYPKSIGEFDRKLAAGRMPKADNEVIFTAVKDDFDATMLERILDKEFRISLDEDKELNVKIVGFAYKPQADGVFMYTGELFMTDDFISSMMTETYNSSSTVKTSINGKEQQYQAGSSFYRVVPNSHVDEGQALAAEELNNFYENGGAKGKDITITAENIFYTEAIELEVSDLYSKKTFKNKTGVSDYEGNNGTIYINQKDYDKLFKKGNYQATVYVDDTDKEIMDKTTNTLETMGFITMPLKDTLINMFDQLASIIRVPMAVILVVALFFIAYFIIRLILKSRSVYFSILRMLGMAKKNIRRILDVEMLLIVNIAYALFIGCIVLVKTGLINVAYITELVSYMEVFDYVILYAVLIVMAYMISGKFAKTLFVKTAMGTYREED